MDDIKTQISEFNEKCAELEKCKFIMATTRIKDLLKCIVNCPELYRLFEAVTKNFNYPEVKTKCLVTVNDGVFKRSYIVLPQTVGQRLALIFCLFVEFDKDSINFNDFLRTYFPEDGYYASYQEFCRQIVKPFQESVEFALKDKLDNAAISPNAARAEYISALELCIAEEQVFLGNSSLQEQDKTCGTIILQQLAAAVKAGDVNLIDALACGYNYFVLYTRSASQNFEPLITAIAEYKKLL